MHSGAAAAAAAAAAAVSTAASPTTPPSSPFRSGSSDVLGVALYRPSFQRFHFKPPFKVHAPKPQAQNLKHKPQTPNHQTQHPSLTHTPAPGRPPSAPPPSSPKYSFRTTCSAHPALLPPSFAAFSHHLLLSPSFVSTAAAAPRIMRPNCCCRYQLRSVSNTVTDKYGSY